MAIKYHPHNNNRPLIEALSNAIETAGWQSRVVVRDLENWGDTVLSAQDLMQKSLKMLKASDACLVEISEKGVGVGLEAGYAHANGIPIIVLAKTGSDIPTTLGGIARKMLFYDTFTDLNQLSEALQRG